ncbi:alkylhydroperoxidase domain protein, Avi_7169 family [Micromonospora pallida]|uniref:Alkylhydroperoxidase domain protein, Avi_7169 family n=1 Tax=Micromonospora pallida TaxID=145854 RepID=A0A1C6SKP3_9ACTN|nr:alkylhydroperoxidase domain protein [Micromonospora pallida]SCL29905.1 alkylhydroperoxidase domain protein, Avi_7169 family [Micromonospora pallida]
MSETLTPEVEIVGPPRFTQDVLGWHPWLHPLDESELTEEHLESLVQASRAKNPYFRLLARDPAALLERTKTDFDIFYNTKAGLPRADRELAATAASRLNGCVYCASVHSAFASHHSKRREEVQRLLDEGVDADLGARWNAIVRATVALTRMPVRFGEAEIVLLREAGLDELEILDAIMSGAFFNWANRLMLSLGEPTT